VPDFGGFITHKVSARYDEDDRMFLPPIRTLGFNPQLRLNDSVLAQSYVEAYDISYPEALRQIEKEVTELKRQLSEKGSYTIDHLGTLTINQDGNYEFAPCEAGILSPELYGLENFIFRPLKDADHVTESEAGNTDKEPVAMEVSMQPSLLEFTDTDDEGEHAISIKTSWIRNAIAIAASVIAFFLLATPVANSNLGTQTMSQLQHHILYKLIPQDTNISESTPVLPEPATPVADTEEDMSEKVTTPAEEVESMEEKTVQPAPTTTYCIVVASQVRKSNAELFVTKLQQEGYKDARIYVHNDVVRVICGEYETESEAYQQLCKMNCKEEFSEAWVYKKKAEV